MTRLKKNRKKAWEKPKKPCSGKCNYCESTINDIYGFYCGSCRRWFCKDHRLPEDHECIGKFHEKPTTLKPTVE